MFGKPIRTREVDRQKVMWMKTNGFDILDEREWSGKWIPVVRVVGNEWEVEGRMPSLALCVMPGRPADVQLLDQPRGRNACAGT